MKCSRLQVALRIGVLASLWGCSDPAEAPFPPGYGEPEHAQDEAKPPEANASYADASHEIATPTHEWPQSDAATDAIDACHGDVAQEGEEEVLDGGPEATVFILQPADGAIVNNPVRFEVGARNVAFVQLFADEASLLPPFVLIGTESMEVTFPEVGYPRQIRLVGFDDQLREQADHEITITVTD